MEGLDTLATQVQNLRHEAETLTSAVLALSRFLETEANRLRREDEESRLRALRSSIKQELEAAKEREESASYDYNRAKSLVSTGEFVLGVIGLISNNSRVSDAALDMLRSPGTRDRPFGRVLVSIGPKGLPEDAGVMSISEKARNSNRTEPEVMKELEKGGSLLLTENEFSFLIDNVLQGQLSLPISLQTCSEMTVSRSLTLRIKKIE